MSDNLEIAYEKLILQASIARRLNNYYIGDQPLMYTHERLRQVFDRTSVNFIQNWAAVVIDTITDRLVFKGWDMPGAETATVLMDFYNSQDIQIMSRKVHRDVLVTGNGYVMLDYIDGQVKAFYNSPMQVVMLYSSEDANKKEMGAKHYYSSKQDTSFMNLYFQDRIEKYSAQGKASNHSAYKLIEEVPNPFNEIPIIHFYGHSELTNVIPLQDAINKTFSDMMVVAEFNAFPQRWMITNSDINNLIASPQSIMRIPKGASDEEGTQVGEFGAANLAMYLDTIDKLTNAIAVISRTPKHYFMNTGANISGEALAVMETPLVKKCIQLQEDYSERWIELASFITDTENVICVWDNVQTEQILTQTQAMQALVGMGIPLVTVLRRFGWGEDEIRQMKDDFQEEKVRRANIATEAMELAMIRAQQGENPYMPETLEVDQTDIGESE